MIRYFDFFFIKMLANINCQLLPRPFISEYCRKVALHSKMKPSSLLTKTLPYIHLACLSVCTSIIGPYLDKKLESWCMKEFQHNYSASQPSWILSPNIQVHRMLKPNHSLPIRSMSFHYRFLPLILAPMWEIMNNLPMPCSKCGLSFCSFPRKALSFCL